MRRRALKTLRWLLTGLVLLLVLIAAVLGFVTGTETGLRWAWHSARDYLPEGIQVASVRGRLIGPLAISGLKVDTQSMHLRLDRFELEWAVAALLKGQVHIENLMLAGLDYTALPSTNTEPTEPFQLPDAINLPVDVRLDAFTLDHATIRTGPDAAPFVIDEAQLLAGLNNQAWVIKRLHATGPQFDVNGGAHLTTRGRYTSEAKLEWEFRAPDVAPIQGVTHVQGGVDTLQVTQSLAAPYNVTAQATIKDLLGELGIDADVVLKQTRLADIKQDLPAVTLDSEINTSGTLADLAYTIKTRAQELQYGVALLETNGRYTGDSVQIEALQITSPDKPGELHASGQVALAQGNAMNVKLNWKKLQWPLAGSPQYTSPEGQFTLTGTPQAYKLNGGLRWFIAGVKQAGRLQLNGNGDLQSFNLQSLALSGAPGTVQGHANVVWAPALTVDAELNGKNVNPGAIVKDWPGALDLNLIAHAEQQPAGLVAEVKKLYINGELRQQPLRVDAQARYAPQGTVIDHLNLVAGKTQLQAAGRVAQTLNLSWSLESSDLGSTVPGTAGELHGQGTVGGTLAEPIVRANLAASALRYQEYHVAELNLDADIDAGGARQSKLSLNASDADAGGVKVKTLSFAGAGTPDEHSLKLDVDSNQGQLQVALAGHLPKSLDRWTFTLNQARLAYGELAPWTLAEPADGLVSAQAQSLEQACWHAGEARLCLQGGRTPQATQAEFSLDALAFAYLAPFLPPDLQVAGALSGRGEVHMPTGAAPQVEVTLHTTAGTIMTRDAQGDPLEVLAFAPGAATLRMQDDGLDAQLELPLAAGGGINLTAAIAAGAAPLAQRPLTGHIEVALENLDVLPALVPTIEQIDGNIQGRLTLSGSLETPQVDGRINLKAPLLAVGGPGLEIKDIDLAVVGSGRRITLDLTANSGGGNLTANGEIGLGDAGLTVDMQVKGDKFQVLDTRDARVFASPDLTIGLTPERINIDGQVSVPRADITPHNLPSSNGAVTVSDDQIIVRPNAGEKQGALGRELHARVRVIVGDAKTKLTPFAERGRNYADTVRRIPGDKVRFQGFGLKAIITGNLLVTQAPGEQALGTGELRVVVGQYKAYGQDLTIQNGRVLFAGGPVSEPALDVRAIRKPAEGILVGVKVRGQLQEPDFSLFSEPSGMTQSEQLSWLVLGRPLNDASAAESSLVTKAALALGVKGGNFLARSIGERIGVDDIGVESDAGDATQAALVVGKYLTPKLYVSYGLGLFKPLSTLRLRYILTPRWQFETQSSGVATGGDLIYSIERGGK